VFTGSGLYGAAQLVLVVTVAKHADPVLIGSYGLAQAVAAPVLMFSHFELRRMLATDVAGRFGLGEYLSLQLVTGVLGLLTCTVIAWAWLGSQLPLVVAVGLKKMLECVGELILGAYQRADRLELLASSMTLRALGDVCVVPGVFVLSGSLPLALVAGCGSSAAILVAYDVPRLRRLGERLGRAPSWRRLLTLARDGTPAGLTATLTSLNGSLPRYLLEVYRDRALLGYFVSLTQLLQAGTLVNTAIAHAELSALSRSLGQGRARFRKRLGRVGVAQVGVQLVALGLMVVAGGKILAAVYRPEYAQYATVAIMLFLGAAVRAVVGALSAGHMVLRSVRAEAAATAMTGVATAAFGLWWIPPWGLMGAALAILAAAALNVVTSGWIIRRSLAA
jgi:O-antigen/teichoic acid export membrane protein